MSLPPTLLALHRAGLYRQAARIMLLVAGLALGITAQAEEPSGEETSRGRLEREAVHAADGHLLRVRNLMQTRFRGDVSERTVESAEEHVRTERQAEDRQQGALVRMVHGEESVTCAVERVKEKTVIETGHLFEAREWHFDGFFIYADDGATGGAGGGAALSFYPCRWAGFGVEAVSLSDLTQDGSASALAYLRLPIDQLALSLHLVAGVGAAFDSGEFAAQFQFGAGLEVRLLYEWGLLLDFRFVETPGENTSLQARLGARRIF